MKLTKYYSRLRPIVFYIFKVYLLGLATLTILRILLLISNIEYAEGIKASYLSDAFLIGFFLDNVVIGIASALPLVAAPVIALFDSYKKAFRYVYNVYYILSFILILGFTVANIPYFNYFYKHIDISVFSWLTHDKEGVGMIFTETSYYKYFLLFIVLCVALSFCIVYFGKKWNKYKDHVVKNKIADLSLFLIASLILCTLCYMGVRRKYRYMEPITSWTPFLNPDSFSNSISLNPLYNTLISLSVDRYKDKELAHKIPMDKAFEILKKDFASQTFDENVSPISRMIEADGEERKANVVIVLMESMSSYYLTDTPNLTPYLNELKDRSLYFNNLYSVASHTNQGIFATLYGFHAFFDKNIMDDRVATGVTDIPLCEGLSFFLNERGYTSSFFVAHERAYNNMDAFLLKNHYLHTNIYSMTDYPKEKIVSNWGVADDYLFEYALGVFNKEQSPFFGTIMTMTNHPEYIIPKEFTQISNDPSEQAVYFSDHSIKQFMEEAEKQDWYKNTIFVFLGDHGRVVGKQPYDMPLSLNHVPLIIYSPLLDDMPRTFDKPAAQIDVFPTVMGLLNMSYENNSLGIDLLKENRPYTVFSTDNKLGCIDNRYLYCYNITSEQEILYDYASRSNENIAGTHQAVFDSIRNYAAATMQVTDYLLKNNLTRRRTENK